VARWSEGGGSRGSWGSSGRWCRVSGLRFTLRARRDVPGLKLGGHRLQLQEQAGGGLHRGLSVTSGSWKYECELNPEYMEARKENRVEIRETNAQTRDALRAWSEE